MKKKRKKISQHLKIIVACWQYFGHVGLHNVFLKLISLVFIEMWVS